MTKKILSVCLFLSIFFSISCTTNRTLPKADPTGYRLTEIPEMSVDYFNVTGESEMVSIFNNALDAMINQEWDEAFNYLKEGNEAVEGEGFNTFSYLLFPMQYSPFVGDKVLDVLVQEFPERRDLALHKEIRDKYPMSITWIEDSFVVSWLDPLSSKWIEQQSKYHPIVEVVINGISMHMVLDTGANTTFFFSDAAEKAGIEPYSDQSILLTSSNEKTSEGGFSIVPSMELGGLIIKNELAMIADRPRFWPKSIDGLIGWPVLCQLVMEMDARDRVIRFHSSYIEEPGEENFFWVGDPAVYVLGGLPRKRMMFFLDSGASRSFFNKSGLDQTSATIVRNKYTWIGGVGGSQLRKSNVVNIRCVFLDGHELIFNEYLNKPIRIPYLGGANGVIGSDIAQAGKLRFNFPAGRISFEPYEDVE